MGLTDSASTREEQAKEFAEDVDTSSLERIDYITLAGIALFGLWSFWYIQATPWRFFTGIPDMVEFTLNMVPPNFSYLVSDLVTPTVETVAIAASSTMVAVVLSIPLAFGAAKNITPATPIYVVCRGIIALTRTIHELIWALIFVVSIGLGAFAGMLGLAFHAIGFMGKLVAEEIEDIDHGQVEAIQATGGSRLEVLRFAVVPQVLPAFVGLSLYRWDINLRGSVVVGLVGAGGIGFELQQSIDLFNYDQVASILLIIFVLVGLQEWFSAWIRHRII